TITSYNDAIAAGKAFGSSPAFTVSGLGGPNPDTTGTPFAAANLVGLQSFNIRLGPQAPTIVTQPNNQTSGCDGSASFTVAASGQQPLSYQWQKNGVNLTDGGNVSGSTTASLTLMPVSHSDAASY